ncbi:amidohydrolase [Shewanella sp. OPT22]|nr:amidohydrolase [Shewanella sp. OPT22]
MQISLLQCQSSKDVQENLSFIRSQLEQLPRIKGEPQLVVLPECVLLFGGHESMQLAALGDGPENPLKRALADIAKKYDVYLIAGSIPEKALHNRVYSRCYFFSNQGEVLGSYDKIHLFDVDVADGTKTYRESDTFCPGERVTVVETPFGKIGLAICYDLRFPELFQALRAKGAEFIALPSAFTKVTGKVHWQVLLQARAIETQSYILAAAQWGQHASGRRETWGQSMIVDPWGEIVAQRPDGTGWIQATPDMAQLELVRQQMPITTQKRFESPTLK